MNLSGIHCFYSRFPFPQFPLAWNCKLRTAWIFQNRRIALRFEETLFKRNSQSVSEERNLNIQKSPKLVAFLFELFIEKNWEVFKSKNPLEFANNPLHERHTIPAADCLREKEKSSKDLFEGMTRLPHTEFFIDLHQSFLERVRLICFGVFGLPSR